MLYLTTREKYDAFTVARALASDRGPDGGRYVPYKMPHFSPADVSALKDRSFGQTIAEVLNLFFRCQLTAWDVDFCIGKVPLRVAAMGQKVFVAECWRNLEGSYDKLERILADRIGGINCPVTSWLRIAIRIAVLTAVFGELQRQGITDSVDVAVPDGDFTGTMAAWYARQMGMPVADIVCACQDDSPALELLVKGRVRALEQIMPELERLIFGTLGVDEVLRGCDRWSDGGSWELTPLMLDVLRKGLYPTIVSDDRVEAVIPNVYSTNSFILEPGTAKAYSGLMDYRAKHRVTRGALLMGESSPMDHAPNITNALGISRDRLKELLR